MDSSGSSKRYGVSDGVIFRVGDRVKFKWPKSDKVYVIKDFMEEDFVRLGGVDNQKDSAFCSLSSLMKIPEQKKIEEFPELVDVADYIQRATGHEGVKKSSCTNCGRTLTAPRSVACHYGPVCFRKIFGKDQPRTEEEKLKRFKRRSIKISEIDYSQLADARKWFS